MELTSILIIFMIFTVHGYDDDHQLRMAVDQEEYLKSNSNNQQKQSNISNVQDDQSHGNIDDHQSSSNDDHHQTNSSDVGVQEDFTDIPMAVIKAITNAVFTACDQVKLLEGVTYEQLTGKNEPDVNNLTLKFVSRGNESRTYNINLAAQAIVDEARSYEADEKLFIYIHGFTSSPRKADFGNVSQALFAKDGISASSIHIIGHSLGSHMASFTGKKFKQRTGQLVGRITGLDPAGPCFTQGDKELRLEASDAQFVDVIHSNAGVAGIEDSVGHVDYYPNGGSAQPGCNVSPGCSHGRSWLLFCESIADERAFPALQCNSWDDFKQGKCSKNISYMGFGSKPTARGKYYLQTNASSPYSLGERGLKYEEKSFSQTISEALF